MNGSGVGTGITGRSTASLSIGREPIAGSVQYLERCRQARQEEEEVARQEEIRLKQILQFCEEYNRECDRFFRLEQALNRSAKTPAKYLFARKDNIACHVPPDNDEAVRDRKLCYGITAAASANPRNSNNNIPSPQDQQTLNQAPHMYSSMQNGITSGGSRDAISPDNANIRQQSASPASTITEQRVNRKENHYYSQNNAAKRPSPKETDIDDEVEEEDEELKEFQALEKEVNLTESIAKSLQDQHFEKRNGLHDKVMNGRRGGDSSIIRAIESRETRIDADTRIVPLSKPERSTGSLSTPDGSDATITAASSQESDDKLTTTTAGTDFSSLIMSIHSSMRKKKGKASSLPPNEIYSISNSDPNQSTSLRRAFDTASLKGQTGKERRRAMSVNPTMSRSMNSHGHASNGLIAEMKVLGHNLSAFSSEDMQISCCTCSGYLWKLCSDRKRWKRRFFHFDRFHKVFFYYKTSEQFRKVKKPNGGVGFIELKDVSVDRERSVISGPLLRTGSDPNLQNAGITSNGSNNNNSISSKKSSHRNRKYATLLRNKKPNQNNNHNHSHVTNNNHNADQRSSSPPFNYVFNVETTNRQFILSTHSFQMMRLWVDVIFTGVESYFD